MNTETNFQEVAIDGEKFAIVQRAMDSVVALVMTAMNELSADVSQAVADSMAGGTPLDVTFRLQHGVVSISSTIADVVFFVLQPVSGEKEETRH
jgi:hypothetical protein